MVFRQLKLPSHRCSRRITLRALSQPSKLSLASPTFRGLDVNVRDLLGVVAFFTQCIDETNLDWVFPTIPNRRNTFDKLCTFSLTYQSNCFVAMLVPMRDYPCLRDSWLSPLFCSTRGGCFSRLLVDVDPEKPGLERRSGSCQRT